MCSAGLCPLIVAAQHGHLEVVETLLLEEWTDGDECEQPTKPDAANQALVAAARHNQKQVE